MKYVKIKEFEEYPCSIYFSQGRYYVDLHEMGYSERLGGWYRKPVHSYSTLAEVKEMLYYHYD